MTQRVILHIGTPKSGTTYLQQRLMANHEKLRGQGVLWPGPRWFFQTQAIDALRNVKPGEQPDPDRAWADLVRRVQDFDGETAIVSMEWMTFLAAHHRQLVIDEFGQYDLHIVITARDLLRQVVSQWQQILRNFRHITLEQYVEQVRREDDATWACKNFWAQHDIVRLIDEWVPLVGADHVHLITLPQSGGDPEVVWRRFAATAGFDSEGFDPGARSNPSTGVVSTELFRRLAKRAKDEGMDHRTWVGIMRDKVSVDVLTRWRKEEGPVTASDAADAWARERGLQMIDDLRAREFELVGDLDELRPGDRLPGRLPRDVTDAELLAAAEGALVALANELGTELLDAREELARRRRGPAIEAVRSSPRLRRLAGRAWGRARAVRRRLRA